MTHRTVGTGLMLAGALWATVAACAPAPLPRPLPRKDWLSQRPLRPWSVKAGGPPGVKSWYEEGLVWHSNPSRKTLMFMPVGGYFPLCDDPDCHMCYREVYRQDEEWEEAPIRRGGGK